MSALGHEQMSRHVCVMSVIPLKADINQHGLHVRARGPWKEVVTTSGDNPLI
jgi:hypothetical protein